MIAPIVSFVVPCYKLAHLLSQCIDSILAQSFTNFEVLVMNDQSPDRTQDVTESFRDPRVIHVLNSQNLGHLRNYNKGIALARGKYIWLISADDYLRSPDVLQKYVRLMEADPRVGYTACPGFSVLDGVERDLVGTFGKHSGTIPGHTFLKKLLDHNFVLAPSVMVRRECYEHLSMFPLTAAWGGIAVDMGWLGDWYLWCLFALSWDVGYFAEPMVCYRIHDLSMSCGITKPEIVMACADSDLGMLWMIRQKALDLGLLAVAKDCLAGIANEYRRQAASKHYRSATYVLSVCHFEDSLGRSTNGLLERKWIRARYYDGAGNRHLFCGERRAAQRCYLASLMKDPRQMKLYGKIALLLMGGFGKSVRKLILQQRNGTFDVAADQATDMDNGYRGIDLRCSEDGKSP